MVGIYQSTEKLKHREIEMEPQLPTNLEISASTNEKRLADFGVRLHEPCYFFKRVPPSEETKEKLRKAVAKYPGAKNLLKNPCVPKFIYKCQIPWRKFNSIYDFKDWLQIATQKLSDGVYYIQGRTNDVLGPKRVKSYIEPVTKRRIKSTQRISAPLYIIVFFEIQGGGLSLIKNSKHRIWKLFPM